MQKKYLFTENCPEIEANFLVLRQYQTLLCKILLSTCKKIILIPRIFLSKNKNCITTSHFYGISCDQKSALMIFLGNNNQIDQICAQLSVNIDLVQCRVYNCTLQVFKSLNRDLQYVSKSHCGVLFKQNVKFVFSCINLKYLQT